MTDKKHYPDFVVTSYNNGLNQHGGERDDVVRLVIEVGSLGRDLKSPSENYKRDVVIQLERYLLALGRAGYRWHDKVLGIAIIGTEYIIVTRQSNGRFRGGRRWDSLYSATFMQIINNLATENIIL